MSMLIFDLKKELEEILNDPLLEGARPFSKPLTADDRVAQKMTEVKEWITKNGREPQKDGDLKEKLIYASLTTLKEKGLWT